MKVKKTKHGFSFKAENSNDSKDLLNMIMGMSECKKENNVCGGPNICENRKYDSTKTECQECGQDYDQVMKESLEY